MLRKIKKIICRERRELLPALFILFVLYTLVIQPTKSYTDRNDGRLYANNIEKAKLGNYKDRSIAYVVRHQTTSVNYGHGSVDTEVNDRNTSLGRVYGSVDKEVNDRNTSLGRVYGSVDTEVNDRNTSLGRVYGSVDKEVNDRNTFMNLVHGSMNRVQGRIYKEVNDRNMSMNRVQGRIYKEVNDRNTTLNRVQGRIYKEVNDRNTTINRVQGRIYKEVNDRNTTLNRVQGRIYKNVNYKNTTTKHGYKLIDTAVNQQNTYNIPQPGHMLSRNDVEKNYNMYMKHRNQIDSMIYNIQQANISPVKQKLLRIPNVHEASTSDIVPYIDETITRKYLRLPILHYEKKVVILSPIRNSLKTLDRFAAQVGKMSYPHTLLSLYFGEDGSKDETFEKAVAVVDDIRRIYLFREAAVTRLNIEGGVHGPHNVRHKKEIQEYRRAHLAKARNHLLSFALKNGNYDYVLWLDSDVTELPVDLVQQMLFAKADVVATPCLFRHGGNKLIYDKNNWRETDTSRRQQLDMQPDAPVFEGYSPTNRLLLSSLKAEGRVVHLDGVGGCALMVKAYCHRSGLRFPEIVYKHHIETEGLAKMATDMGYTVVGLPFVEVFH